MLAGIWFLFRRNLYQGLDDETGLSLEDPKKPGYVFPEETLSGIDGPEGGAVTFVPRQDIIIFFSPMAGWRYL